MTRHLERALDLFADVILNPAFADNEYLRLKLRRLADVEDRDDNAEQIADDVLPRLLYRPGQSLCAARLGTPESVMSITREDIIDFYRRHFVPGNAALVVVGDVGPERFAAALEARFGPLATRTGSAGRPICPGAVAGRRTAHLLDRQARRGPVGRVSRPGRRIHQVA